MKRILKIFIVEAIVLYLVSQVTTGLTFTDGITGLLITAGGLTVASFVIKPLINLLLLPINLITFGFFRFLTNTITLFLVDIVLPQFSVGSFFFKGLHAELVVIPNLHLPAGALSYFAFSFLISFTTTVIYWLVK